MDSYGVPVLRMDWDSANMLEAWRCFRQHAQLMFTGLLQSMQKAAKPKEHHTQRTCSNCTGQHSNKDVCPAKGKRCINCKKFYHFARACKSKPQTKPDSRCKTVHTVTETAFRHEEDIDEEEESGLYIDSITIENEGKSSGQAYPNIELGSPPKKVRFKVDTGTQANAIPVNIFQTLFQDVALKPVICKLTDYVGYTLTVDGKCKLKCRYKNSTLLLDFHIVDTAPHQFLP